MQTQNLGYPRIDSNRELKKACEQYWIGKISDGKFTKTGHQIQKNTRINLTPIRDFSF